MQQALQIPAFRSRKYVEIDNIAIRTLRIALFAAIFTFVFIYQCLYRGLHLALVDIDGDARFYLSGPRVGIPECYEFKVGCNEDYRKAEDLEYCSQHKTLANESHEQKACWYFGGSELAKAIPNGGMMVPTRIKRYRRHAGPGCDPTHKYPSPCEVDNHTGVGYLFVNSNGSFQKNVDSNVKPVEDAYVADIEHFTVTIDHSFAMAMGAQVFKPGETRHDGMKGYWCHAPEPCQNGETTCDVLQTCHEGERRHPMMCIGKDCQGSIRTDSLFAEGVEAPAQRGLRRKLRLPGKKGDHALKTESFASEEDFPIYKFKFGDSFRIDTLLKIANVSMDTVVDGGRTLRTGGGTLFMELDYRNGLDESGGPAWIGGKTSPWHVEAPDYTYTVRFLPHSTMNIDEIPDWLREDRKYDQDLFKYTGIRLYLKQHGQIAIWSNFNFVLTLVSVTTLISAIQFLLEKLAMLSGYKELIVEKRETTRPSIT